MKKSLEVVTPRQSNYDTYFLPEEVRDIGRDTPLYRLVAYWAMRSLNYVCRDDISHAFGISLRQASGIISAICRKHEEIFCSLKRVKTGKGNVVKSYILVQNVLEKTARYRNSFAMPNLPRKVREKQAQLRGKLMWAQLLSGSYLGLANEVDVKVEQPLLEATLGIASSL